MAEERTPKKGNLTLLPGEVEGRGQSAPDPEDRTEAKFTPPVPDLPPTRVIITAADLLPADPDGRFDRKLANAERRVAVLDLRRKGYSFAQIARVMGYKSKDGAYKMYQRALNALIREPAESLRQLEVERLDALLRGIMPLAESGHPESVRAALTIMERRAKLLGLDAPTKMDVVDKRAMEEFKAIVLEVLGEVDPAIRDAVVARLKAAGIE